MEQVPQSPVAPSLVGLGPIAIVRSSKHASPLSVGEDHGEDSADSQPVGRCGQIHQVAKFLYNALIF